MSYQLIIILVLYKCTLKESLTYKTFLQTKNFLNLRYKLIIYNNSREIKINDSNEYDIVTPEENRQLVGAYNYTLKIANEEDIPWMLVLDQDTELNKEYISRITEEINNAEKDTAAILPIVKKGEALISPFSYNPTFGTFWLKKTIITNCITKDCISAINSCSVLNTKALKKIGGFSSKYPLDCLDHWYFYQFYKHNLQIKIVDTYIEHDISLLDYQHCMNEKRYVNYLNANLLLAKEQGFTATMMFRLRTFFRSIKQIGIPHKRKYIRLSLPFLYK